MLVRFLEQQPANCTALLSTEVQKNAKELRTLTDVDLPSAEDVAKALKLLKVATQDLGVTRDIKDALSRYLGKRPVCNKTFLCMASALDPHFKTLHFLEEDKRQDTYTTLLSNFARNAHYIPGASVATGRVFSIAGDIVTAQRKMKQLKLLCLLFFFYIKELMRQVYILTVNRNALQ